MLNSSAGIEMNKEWDIHGSTKNHNEQYHAIHFAESHEEFEKLLREAGVKNQHSIYYASRRSRESPQLEDQKKKEVTEIREVNDDFEKFDDP